MPKFEQIDLLESLERIMQSHTKHYQSDFDIDKEILTDAAQKAAAEDRRYLWMARSSGTWCLRERDTFIKDSREHNTWCFYGEQSSDKILAYAVEITGLENGKVMGNLYPLDYEKHFQHVRDSSLPSDTVKLVYEHGEQIQIAGQSIHPEKETSFGKFLRFENVPNDPEKLDSLLYEERRSRAAMRPGSIEKHIERLTGRARKPSIRSQLKAEPEKKQPVKPAARSKNSELEV